tara:strand:+ start:28 stop:345 length:318 start_codon:yes stop_codon:yes gene_type:complete
LHSAIGEQQHTYGRQSQGGFSRSCGADEDYFAEKAHGTKHWMKQVYAGKKYRYPGQIEQAMNFSIDKRSFSAACGSLRLPDCVLRMARAKRADPAASKTERLFER